MHAGSGHWSAQQHSIKAAQTPCTLTQPSTTKQQRGTALIYTDTQDAPVLKTLSHVCANEYKSSPGLSFSHNRKLIHTTLNNSDTCGAAQCGSPSKACYQSNTEDICSILSGSQTAYDHSSASVSLSEALVCRKLLCLPISSGKPTGGQQLAHKNPIRPGPHTQCYHIHRTVRTWVIRSYACHSLKDPQSTPNHMFIVLYSLIRSGFEPHWMVDRR